MHLPEQIREAEVVVMTMLGRHIERARHNKLLVVAVMMPAVRLLSYLGELLRNLLLKGFMWRVMLSLQLVRLCGLTLETLRS